MKSPMASALLNTVSSAGNTSLKVVDGAVTVLSKASLVHLLLIVGLLELSMRGIGLGGLLVERGAQAGQAILRGLEVVAARRQVGNGTEHALGQHLRQRLVTTCSCLR